MTYYKRPDALYSVADTHTRVIHTRKRTKRDTVQPDFAIYLQASVYPGSTVRSRYAYARRAHTQREGAPRPPPPPASSHRSRSTTVPDLFLLSLSLSPCISRPRSHLHLARGMPSCHCILRRTSAAPWLPFAPSMGGTPRPLLTRGPLLKHRDGSQRNAHCINKLAQVLFGIVVNRGTYICRRNQISIQHK